jgi:hypothetical protein
MSVYVDESIHKFGRMIMCHMVADTVDELHEMAEKIGIQRRWFQGDKSIPHYDICKSKRVLAVRFGALEMTGRELVRRFSPRRKK